MTAETTFSYQPGDMLADYKIIETMHFSANSVLYRAVHVGNTDDQLEYLIKQYRNTTLDSDTIRYETAVSQDIENHFRESIVLPILYTVPAASGPCAVMQLRSNGKFLDNVILEKEKTFSPGSIPLKTILGIISALLRSVACLHGENETGRGYLHLDLHPGNIFLESYVSGKEYHGSVKLIDLSSAVSIEDTADSPSPLSSLTPGYSAPEQYYGSRSICCSATDFYMIGAVMFRFLFGRTVDSVKEDRSDFIKESLKKQGYSRLIIYMLDNLFEAILSPVPVYRFASAGDFLQAIQKITAMEEALKNSDYTELIRQAYEQLIPCDYLKVQNSIIDIKECRKAITELENSLLTEHIDVSRSFYTFNSIWQNKDLFRDKISQKEYCSLISSGIVCCNYKSDDTMGRLLLRQLENVKSSISVSQYMDIMTRATVKMIDRYEFKKAVDILSRNLQCMKLQKEAGLHCAELLGLSADSAKMKPLGRVCSALASACAYSTLTERKELANPSQEQINHIFSLFDMALEEFNEDPPNTRITLAHTIQYCIEIGDLERYSKYADRYFSHWFPSDMETGAKLNLLLQKKEYYAYLALIKALERLFPEQIDESVVTSLTGLLSDIALQDLNEHPAQLIYKHAALALYKKLGPVQAVDDLLTASVMVCSANAPDDQDTLTAMTVMQYQTAAIYNTIFGHEEENRKLLTCLKKYSKKSGWKQLAQNLKSTEDLCYIYNYESA